MNQRTIGTLSSVSRPVSRENSNVGFDEQGQLPVVGSQLLVAQAKLTTANLQL
jgi:hypothetical protein